MGPVTGAGPRPDAWIGRLLAGRYRVVARIGRGSTGSVYAAQQEPLGRQVAVKVLEVAGTEAPGLAEARFLREASLLSRLSHPNTVRVFDYGTAGPHPWLAMELCRGRPLSELMAAGPMDPLRLVRIVLQVCGSLQEAHELGLVHRDLKPANVLVETTPDGSDKAKVVDFGLVKAFDDGDQLTARGLIVGTPMFMSPEQVRGHTDVDPRSDLYALGVLLYRGLCGAYPFEPSNVASVLLAHVHEPPAPLPAGLGLPRSLRSLVGRLLQKDREARPGSVSIVAHQLALTARVLEGELADQTASAVIEGAPSLSWAGSQPSAVSLVVTAPARPTPGAALALGVALVVTGFVALSGGYFVAQMVQLYLGS